MAVLSLGHLCVDLCQGALPALLPFLIAAHHWSYGQASALVLAATLCSSVIQPLFGHLSDGRSLPWLMPGGVALAGIGISLAGIAGSYGLTFAVVVLSGLGVAAYHPEASRFANYVAGARRATAMSLFSVGGNAGLRTRPGDRHARSPSRSGCRARRWWSSCRWRSRACSSPELGRLVRFRPAAATRATGAAGEETEPDEWRPFITPDARDRGAIRRLLRSDDARAAVLRRRAPHLEGHANAALTVMLACGAVGTLIGGRLADRFSRRIVLRVSLGLLTPLMVVMLSGGVGVAIAALAFIGAATIATFSVTVVMGQEYLPGRLGRGVGGDARAVDRGRRHRGPRASARSPTPRACARRSRCLTVAAAARARPRPDAAGGPPPGRRPRSRAPA